MKLETNFIASTTNWVKLLSNVFLTISILLMLYIVYVYFTVDKQQKKTEYLTQNQEKLQQHIQRQKLQIQQHMTDDQFQQLKQDINTINRISDFNSLDIARVLYVIELSLPKNVHIEQFSYDATRAESNLTAQSSEPELLNEFITQLQQDPRFPRIDLIDQKQLNIKQSVAFRYRIIIQHKIQ